MTISEPSLGMDGWSAWPGYEMEAGWIAERAVKAVTVCIPTSRGDGILTVRHPEAASRCWLRMRMMTRTKDAQAWMLPNSLDGAMCSSTRVTRRWQAGICPYEYEQR